MTVTALSALLARMRDLGIKLWAEGGKLRYRGPEAVLTPELLRELAGRKTEILEALARADAGEPALPAVEPVPRDGELPLSFAQQSLWFLARLEPDSAHYNEPAAFHVRGRLHPEALERTLSEIVRRHEVLRTTFHEVEGRPQQRIHSASAVALPRVDLAGLEAVRGVAEAGRLAVAEARRPFDLERGPLLRPVLLRTAA